MDDLRLLLESLAVGLSLAAAVSYFGWRLRHKLRKLIYAGGSLPAADPVSVEVIDGSVDPPHPLRISRSAARRQVNDPAAAAALEVARLVTRRVRRIHLTSGLLFWLCAVSLQVWSLSTRMALAEIWPLLMLHCGVPGLMVCIAIVGGRRHVWVAWTMAYLVLVATATLILGHRLGSVSALFPVSMQLMLMHVSLGLGALLLLRRELRSMSIFLFPFVPIGVLSGMAIPFVLPDVLTALRIDRWEADAAMSALRGQVLPVAATAVLLMLLRIRYGGQRQASLLLVLLLTSTGFFAAGVVLDVALAAPTLNGLSLPVVLSVMGLLCELYLWFFGLPAVVKLARSLPSRALQQQGCWLALAALSLFVTGLEAGDRPSGTVAPAQWFVMPAYAGGLVLDLLLLRWVRSTVDATHPKRLLLLRVFQGRRKRERLLDDLNDAWRRVGVVHLLGGPDLAMRTLNLATLNGQMQGTLDSQFCRTEEDIDRRLASFNYEMDAELQYPVNEIDCYGDIWQSAALRLARQSDVVLVDLRGFKPENTGSRLELAHVVRHVSLSKVIVLVDQETDNDDLQWAALEAWRRLPADSPNARSPDPVLRTLQGEDSDRGLGLTSELFTVAFGRATGRSG